MIYKILQHLTANSDHRIKKIIVTGRQEDLDEAIYISSQH